MADVQEALRLRIIGDATVTSPSYLDGQPVFFLAPDVDTNNLDAWIVISQVSHNRDTETGHLAEIWQFDIWSRAPDRGKRVAERLDAFVPWNQAVAGTGVLPDLTTRRLAEPIYAEVGPGDMTDLSASTLHHKVRQLRVATYPI